MPAIPGLAIDQNIEKILLETDWKIQKLFGEMSASFSYLLEVMCLWKSAGGIIAGFISRFENKLITPFI